MWTVVLSQSKLPLLPYTRFSLEYCTLSHILPRKVRFWAPFNHSADACIRNAIILNQYRTIQLLDECDAYRETKRAYSTLTLRFLDLLRYVLYLFMIQ